MKKCNQCGLLLDYDVKVCRKCGSDTSKIEEIEKPTLARWLTAIGWILVVAGFIAGFSVKASFDSEIYLRDFQNIAMIVVWITSLFNSLIFFGIGKILHNQNIIVYGLGYEPQAISSSENSFDVQSN